ncbi:MAG: hypothetical protein ABIH41_03960 [Nanoarchaeota archaeon]
MRILKQDPRAGILTLLAESGEDFWFLSRIIDTGDDVRGTAERKVKIGSGENASTTRKKFTVTIKTTNVEYTPQAIRINGTILEGPDDMPRGAHQAIAVQEGDQITITKSQWLSYHRQIIDDALTQSKETQLLVIFDRSEAIIATLKSTGHTVLCTLKGNVAQKRVENAHTQDFFAQLAKAVQEQDRTHKSSHIILASAAFWKDYLRNAMEKDMLSRCISTTCSEVNVSAIPEILKRPELKAALHADRSAREENLIAEILTAISKDKACYGMLDTGKHANMGAIETAIISETLINRTRQDGRYDRLAAIMRAVEQGKGMISIVSGEGPCKQLDGLGGIAGTLRWTT